MIQGKKISGANGEQTRAGSSGIPEHLMLSSHISGAGSKIVMVRLLADINSLGWNEHNKIWNSEKPNCNGKRLLNGPATCHGPCKKDKEQSAAASGKRKQPDNCKHGVFFICIEHRGVEESAQQLFLDFIILTETDNRSDKDGPSIVGSTKSDSCSLRTSKLSPGSCRDKATSASYH